MGFFTDDCIELTDENPKPDAFGRSLFLNKSHIVAFYRREDDHSKTNVFTSDGKSYVVKQSVQEISEMID